MPKFRGNIIGNKIIIDVFITSSRKVAISSSDTECKETTLATTPLQSNVMRFKGLVDTGATVTAISSEVVKKLDLIPFGEGAVNGVNHCDVVSTYNIDVAIPITEIGLNADGQPSVQQIHMKQFFTLPVFEAKNLTTQGIDLLIGMDVIRHCMLIVDNEQFTLVY
jgi:hypothetical protein